MPEAIVWEFDGVGRDKYEAVNEKLGIDPDGGGEDLPEGMIHHTGAEKPGGLVIFEVWESKEDHARFLDEQLRPALDAASVTTPPTRAEWLVVAATTSPETG
jgi:hypothetical protein